MSLPKALLFLLAGCATSLITHDEACAQSRIAVFGTVGFGGEAEGELDLANANVEDDAELKDTLGIGFVYDKELHRHFSLGALFRLYSWDAKNYSWETNGDNSGAGFDVALLPRLRFPLTSVELYGALPVGLTAASKDDNNVIGEVEYDLGFGYNLGFFGGLQFPLTRELALFGELGLQIRKISNTGTVKSTDTEGDVIYRSSQLTANFGVAFL